MYQVAAQKDASLLKACPARKLKYPVLDSIKKVIKTVVRKYNQAARLMQFLTVPCSHLGSTNLVE
jgi:hypothetical protein